MTGIQFCPDLPECSLDTAKNIYVFIRKVGIKEGTGPYYVLKCSESPDLVYVTGIGCPGKYIGIVEQVKAAIKLNTKLIYTDTPANPTIGITDLRELAKIAHDHNIPLVVDNTFCSPYLQKPLDFGIDIVLHSMTKFINGHADIVGGIVVAKEKEIFELLYRKSFHLNLLQIVLQPFPLIGFSVYCLHSLPIELILGRNHDPRLF